MPNDAELVAGLARGDEAALAELLRRYERPLTQFIYRHTGGREVDDLYQETWWRVVRAADRFDPSKRFTTWLFQIAINLCRDWHRRQRPETAVDGDSGTDDAARRTDTAMDVRRLLARLSEPQREVLILRFYHDLTEDEIATVVGCPKGTVKSRMHAALARLAAAAEAEWK